MGKELDIDSEMKFHIKELYEERELLDAYSLTKKKKLPALVLAFIFSPLGYAYTKKFDYVILSLLTFNYFLLGFIIGPVHIFYLYSQAEEKTKDL
ncbi:MAG: hypothetical protein WC492_01580 [Candidatus Micrarchaeia archaeon]